MNDYNIDIPDTIFVNDFTIIYKGKEEREGQIVEPIEEIKTSKDEFFHKLRYFKRRTPDMNTISEIYIHDEYSISNFKQFIGSIETKSLLLNESNFNIFHQLSIKYEYYELQSKIEDFIQKRPDIQLIVNQLSAAIQSSKSENQADSKAAPKEIDPIKEEIISKHLDICLQNDNLMQLPIPSLHRIFSSPTKILKNHHLLYQFVRKMIDKYESSQKEGQDPSKIKESLKLLIGTLDYQKMTGEEIETLLNKNYLSSVFIPPTANEISAQLQLKTIEERIQKIESTFSEKIQILEKDKEEKEKEIKEMSLKILHQEEIIKNYESKIQSLSKSEEKQQNQKQAKPAENQQSRQAQQAKQTESVQSHTAKQTESSQLKQTQQTKQNENQPNKASQNQQVKSKEASQNHQTQQPKQNEANQSHNTQQKQTENSQNQQSKTTQSKQTESSQSKQSDATQSKQTESSQSKQSDATQSQQQSKLSDSSPQSTKTDKDQANPVEEKAIKTVGTPPKRKKRSSSATPLSKNSKIEPKLLNKEDELFDVSSSVSSSTVSSSTSTESLSSTAKDKQSSSHHRKKEKLIINKEFRKDQYQGIITELTRMNKGNINDKGIIQITGNRDEDNGTFSSLVNYSYNGVNYTSESDPNSFICFDFKELKVAISAYTIKSSSQRFANYLVSWVLEGSNDKNEWTNIDSHSNDRSLCSKSKSCTFVVEDKEKTELKFRFIQIRMTGKSPRNNFVFSIVNVELFGKCYSSS